MNRSLLLAGLLLTALPGAAQTNRTAVAPLSSGLGGGDLLGDLRITLPGEDDGPEKNAKTAQVFIPPELLIGNTNELEAVTQPIPLLKGSYPAQVNLHMTQAMRLMSSNQVFLATRELWQASRLDPALADPVAGLALTYLLAEDNERAGNLLERLVARSPGEEDLLFNLASARYGQKRHAEAVQILESLVASEKYPFRIHYNLGINLQAMGRVQEAVEALRKAHRISPRNPAPLLAISRLQARRGDVAAMLGVLREAQPLVPPRQWPAELNDPAFYPHRDNPDFRGLLNAEAAP